jgi:hypothetical protein
VTRAEKRHIVVDDEILAKLRELANPGETPATVIRRVLGLPERPQGRRSSVLKPYLEEEPTVA